MGSCPDTDFDPFLFLSHAAQQSFHDVISNIHFKNSFFD